MISAYSCQLLSYHYIFFVLQMKESLKIEYKEEDEQNESAGKKKEASTVQREFYMCFCSKKYHSYSALYLHAKKVHDKSLNMKCLRVKSHQWSGSVKNIFYEFHEDESDSESHSQEVQGKNIKAKKKQKQAEKPAKIKVKIEENMLIKQQMDKLPQRRNKFFVENSIAKVFNIFKQKHLQGRSREQNSTLIDQFICYINQNYRDFDEEAQCVEYCQEKTCEKIPFAFNHFYLRLYPGPVMNNNVLSQLNMLGKWLYEESYSDSLIVDARKYEDRSPQI